LKTPLPPYLPLPLLLPPSLLLLLPPPLPPRGRCRLRRCDGVWVRHFKI
jgi:hypothetical protein